MAARNNHQANKNGQPNVMFLLVFNFQLVIYFKETLERIAAVQLDNHLTDHQLYAKMQSAYRKYHSTAIVNQHECVLVLLDLSAAFGTIDHKILIN